MRRNQKPIVWSAGFHVADGAAGPRSVSIATSASSESASQPIGSDSAAGQFGGQGSGSRWSSVQATLRR